MPVDWADYPAEWDGLHTTILERDRRCCVTCQLPQYGVGVRCDDGTFLLSDIGETAQAARQLAKELHEMYEVRFIVIVLAVHHLCRTPGCTDESHLVSVCQYHHHRGDKRHHRINAARTRRQKKAHAEVLF